MRDWRKRGDPRGSTYGHMPCLGKVFGRRPDAFIYFKGDDDMEQERQARNVAILIYENVEPLDFAGPYEVFISGSDRGKDFKVYTIAENDGPLNALGILN